MKTNHVIAGGYTTPGIKDSYIIYARDNRLNEVINNLVVDQYYFNVGSKPVWNHGNLNDLYKVHNNGNSITSTLYKKINNGFSISSEVDKFIKNVKQYGPNYILDEKINSLATNSEINDVVENVYNMYNVNGLEHPNSKIIITDEYRLGLSASEIANKRLVFDVSGNASVHVYVRKLTIGRIEDYAYNKYEYTDLLSVEYDTGRDVYTIRRRLDYTDSVALSKLGVRVYVKIYYKFIKALNPRANTYTVEQKGDELYYSPYILLKHGSFVMWNGFKISFKNYNIEVTPVEPVRDIDFSRKFKYTGNDVIVGIEEVKIIG